MAVQNARIAVVRWHQDVDDTRAQIERSKQQWCTAAQEWLQYVYAHLFEQPYSYGGPTVQLEFSGGHSDEVVRQVLGLRLERKQHIIMRIQNEAHLPVFQLEGRIPMPGPTPDHLQQPIL